MTLERRDLAYGSALSPLCPLSVMAGRVPATRPQPVRSPRRLYNRQCVGGRDTPGHDDMEQIHLPRPLILMP